MPASEAVEAGSNPNRVVGTCNRRRFHRNHCTMRSGGPRTRRSHPGRVALAIRFPSPSPQPSSSSTRSKRVLTPTASWALATGVGSIATTAQCGPEARAPGGRIQGASRWTSGSPHLTPSPPPLPRGEQKGGHCVSSTHQATRCPCPPIKFHRGHCRMRSRSLHSRSKEFWKC